MPSVSDPVVAIERAISQYQRFTDDPWGEHLITGMIGAVLLWGEMNLARPDDEEHREEKVKRLMMEGAAEYRRLRKRHVQPRRRRRGTTLTSEYEDYLAAERAVLAAGWTITPSTTVSDGEAVEDRPF